MLPRMDDRYPGDFHGAPPTSYEPVADGLAEPGEVVWAWVPFEENPRKGKDRPALIIGRDGPWLLALTVTSKDHHRDAAQEASVGRLWTDIGRGGWDPKGRPSEARINRIVRLDPARVRREGAAIDRETFDRVIREMKAAGSQRE